MDNGCRYLGIVVRHVDQKMECRGDRAALMDAGLAGDPEGNGLRVRGTHLVVPGSSMPPDRAVAQEMGSG